MALKHKGYHKSVLPNGIRLIGEEVPGFNSCTVGIFIFTGSRDEQPSELGIAHFTEHMLFKGTEKRTALEISKAIDNVGGILNAYTNKEYTCYYSKVVSDKLDIALDVLSDMFLNSIFLDEELQKEKEVIIQEIHMVNDTPDDLIHDLLFESLYGKRGLGSFILGTEEIVRSFDRKTIKSFVENYYLNERIVVACAGNFNWERFRDMATELFGNRGVKVTNFPERRSQIKPSKVTVKKEHLNQVHYAIGFPTISIYDEDKYPLKILNYILGAGMSSLLFQELREMSAYVYSTYSSVNLYQDTGFLYIYFATTPEKKDLCINKIEEILHRVKSGKISEDDIKNAKEQIKGYTLISLDSSDAKFSYNARSELYYNKFMPIEEELEKLFLLNKTDIIEVANKYLDLTNAGIASVEPENGAN
ncbi:MAG: insulinase family protein [Proteobacteria bacterium]|nr:insulinase family protein [Pseudomonadota bacterium]